MNISEFGAWNKSIGVAASETYAELAQTHDFSEEVAHLQPRCFEAVPIMRTRLANQGIVAKPYAFTEGEFIVHTMLHADFRNEEWVIDPTYAQFSTDPGALPRYFVGTLRGLQFLLNRLHIPPEHHQKWLDAHPISSQRLRGNLG